jgi:negative regulator of sigma E activity
MQHSTALNAKGRLTIQQFDKEGNLIHTEDTTNVVVSDGLDYITERMKDATTTVMSHMAVGSDNTAAAAGDSTLGVELGRVALTSTTVSSNTITYVGDFPAGTGTGAVVEAGVLNNVTGGDLLCRTVFSVVNKAAADTLKITWTLTVSDS